MKLFQVIFVPLFGLLGLWTLARARRGQTPLRQSLFWAAVWLAGAMAIARPQSTSDVAAWLGIDRGADLVFYLAIVGGLLACLYFYGRCRRLEVLLTEALRRIALDHARRGTDAPPPPVGPSPPCGKPLERSDPGSTP
jgi:hypothetical protein